MTIAVISNTVWSLVNFRGRLMEALRADGHRVIAIGPPDNYIDKLSDYCDTYVPLYHLNADGKNPLTDYKLIREFRAILKQYKIELAFSFTAKPNIYCAMAAKNTGVRVVPTVNGLGNAFIAQSHLSRLMLKLYRSAFKRCTQVVMQNPDDLAFFYEKSIISKKQGRLSPGSGVDLNRFGFTPKKPFGVPRKFLFSARLVKEKGIGEFIEAAALTRKSNASATFKVIGMVAKNPSSIDEVTIRKYADAGLIEYEGHTDDMVGELCRSDILVLPSYYREGIPRVLLEGLSVGRPIITTDSIGCRETVIHNHNGILVPIKDAKALSDAMCKLASYSDAKLQVMSMNSRQLAEDKFDEKRVIELYRGFTRKQEE